VQTSTGDISGGAPTWTIKWISSILGELVRSSIWQGGCTCRFFLFWSFFKQNSSNESGQNLFLRSSHIESRQFDQRDL
jgi:hypothetical protein